MNTPQWPDFTSYNPAQDLLSERVVLVTGAGAGIGRAAALAYARHGAQVMLLGRTVRKLEAVYDEIVKAGGPRPSIVPMDLGKAEGQHYQALIDALEQGPGRLDGILHNAAVLGDLTPLEQYDVGRWQQVLHVNLSAPFVLTRCLAPLLRMSPDASVIFTSSSVGRRGRAYWGAYAVSKGGLEVMSQVLADEWGNLAHLRANCINPGATRTDMRYHAYPGENRDLLKRPEEIMAPYLYLMGPDSRGVSGQSVDCQPSGTVPTS